MNHETHLFEESGPDPKEPLTADQLADELSVAVQCNMADWLIDAVVTAVTTDDLPFLIKQTERNVPGWTKP